MYYFAYGTNLNKKIFLRKFKNAKLLKKYALNNYKVVFRTKYIIPDLQRKINSKVQGLIYQIDKNIEKNWINTKSIQDYIVKNILNIKRKK